MHRAYTAEKYYALTEQLREARPEIAITTDFIVGFPGETDEDFLATRALAAGIGFDNAFIFRYSPRRDTPAAIMAEQVEEGVKEDRNRELLRVIDDSARAKGEALVGRKVEILCEGPSRTNEARLMGRSPGNKIVLFEGSPRHVGEIFDVQITRSTGFTLYGDPAVLA